MRNTKEITTGAMLLAIFGTVLLIDRQFSFMLNEVLVLAAPILIIVFGNMYNFKDGTIFSIALLIISFVLSPRIYSYFYITLGSLIGNVYNFLINKGVRSMTLLLVVVILFIVADLCYMFIVSPLLLNESFDQVLALTKEAVTDLFPEQTLNNMSKAGMPIDSLLKIGAFSSFILVGLMEGLIVYLVSFMILKRFNINTSINIGQILVLKPVAAYIMFLCTSSLFFVSRIKDTTIVSIIVGLGLMSILILSYYGYIYYIMLLRKKFNRNLSFIVIIGLFFLFPLSLIILFITGFLYGAGPLKKYIYIGRNQNEQN